jgi:predicted DNA-binding transcriptional regulator AlpA
MSKALSYRVAANRLGLSAPEIYDLVERGELRTERRFGQPPRIELNSIFWYEREQKRKALEAAMPRKIYGRGSVSRAFRVFGFSGVIERIST